VTKPLVGYICALIFVAATIVFAQPGSVNIGKAEALLKNLQGGRYAAVVKEFNPVMVNAISEEKLRAVWEMLTAQFGAVKSIDERRGGELRVGECRLSQLTNSRIHQLTNSPTLYCPSMLKAKNRLPPLPSTPDLA
jgi:hypothetical protein